MKDEGLREAGTERVPGLTTVPLGGIVNFTQKETNETSVAMRYLLAYGIGVRSF